MRIYASLAAGALLSLAGVDTARAYEIGSDIAVRPAFDVHETLTVLAMECYAAQAGPTFDCAAYAEQIAERTRPDDHLDDDTDINALPFLVRWPDDPTRLLNRLGSTLDFGMKLRRDCDKEVEGEAWIDQAGLTCSSHYGRLSFFHAMQNPRWNQPDSDRTHRLVLQWADFAFRAATDATFRDTDYCTAVKDLAGPDLASEMTFASSSWCEPRHGKRQWKVRTLFSRDCAGLIVSKSCWTKYDAADDRIAGAAARGAILHLIQDSFSQAHAWRPTAQQWPARERGPFAPIISCATPRQFYRYREQQALMHNAADRPPQLDASCLQPGRPVDDAITASATALYYLERGDRAGFARYLETRVFPR